MHSIRTGLLVAIIAARIVPEVASAQPPRETEQAVVAAIELVRARMSALHGLSAESIVVQRAMVAQLRPIVLDTDSRSALGTGLTGSGFMLADASVARCGTGTQGHVAALARASCSLVRAPFYFEIARPTFDGDTAQTRIDVYFKSPPGSISYPVSFVYNTVFLRKVEGVWRADALRFVSTP